MHTAVRLAPYVRQTQCQYPSIGAARQVERAGKPHQMAIYLSLIEICGFGEHASQALSTSL